jgi:WD40 repeat protein
MSANETIDALEKIHPAAVRLAEAVSFAMMIDRAFLRAVRLALVPEGDAGTEADLWFSPLVQSRTGDGIVLDPDVADALRRRLPPERVERIWSLTRNQHAWLPPSLQLEEEIAYLSVSREPTAREQLAERLRSVLAAMVSGERAGLAQWALRALAMFPSAVQELPEARMLETGSRLRLGGTIDVPDADEELPPWMPWLAPPSLGRVSLDFELREDELEVRTTLEDRPMQIPSTNPLLLEVSWETQDHKRQARQITFRPGETVTMIVGRGELRLRAITGEEYSLRERGFVPDRLLGEIVDPSVEMQWHAQIIGRGEEIEQILDLANSHQTIAVLGDIGLGKTAFVCELIREAGRRDIPAFGHFFRFGDLRLESIRSAERSIIAQLALRFGLDDRMVDMPLADVLQRLRFQAERPARLLIVIDDVDKARDVQREVVRNALEVIFPSVPAGVSVIATTTTAEVQANWIHRLNPRARPLPFSADNEAEVELFSRLAARGFTPTVDGVRTIILDTDLSLRHAISAASAAIRPLPAELFDLTADSSAPIVELLRIQGQEVSILNEATRRFVTEVLGELAETAQDGHHALSQRLLALREVGNVNRYYLLNAPRHFAAAGDFAGARTLCTDFEFLREKLDMFGVGALLADFFLSTGSRWTPQTEAVSVALREHASEIEDAPHFASILYTALLAQNQTDAVKLPPLPLVPELVRTVDLTRHRPRKHHDRIRGSVYVRWAQEPLRVTWSDDGTARLWPDSGGDPEILDHGAPVTAFEARQPYAISADADGFLHLWNIRDGKRLTWVAAHDRAISGILVDQAGSLIVTWSGSDPIRLWTWYQAEERIRPLGELEGHSSVVTGCALMPGGGLIVSASRGGTCRLWSISGYLHLGTVGLSGPATGMAYHWDASSRIIMTAKRTLDIVNVSQLNLTVNSRPIQTGHDLPVSGVAISPRGREAATWSEDQTIRLWDIPMAGEARRVLRGHRAAVTGCRFVGRSLPWLVSTDADGVAILWKTDSGEMINRFDRHTRAIRTVSVDGESIFTAGDDGIPWEWYAETGDLITDHPSKGIAACVVIPHTELSALTINGDAKVEIVQDGASRTLGKVTRPILATSARAAFVSAADGSNAYVIDYNPLRHQPVDLPPDLDVAICAISDTGLLAIGTMDGRVLSRWVEVERYEAPVAALSFATLSRLVSASIDGKISVNDLSTRVRLHRFDAHRSRILTLAAHEDFAVTGASDGTLRVWDLRSGREIPVAAAHDSAIIGLGLEGNIVVSASLDRTIRVFDYKLGRQLAVCRGHRDTITGMAIAGYEGVIYSCSEDRTIRQWEISTGRQKAIVYGTAPFRCISWKGGKLVAGDDAGNLWTVKKNAAVAEEREASVYICHSRDDSELAERLAEDLSEAQIRVSSSNASAVRDASTVLVIASPALAENTYALKEVKEAIRNRKQIVVLLQGVNRFDVAREWPELAEYQSFKDSDWSDEESYRLFIGRLIAVIRE